MFPFKEYRKTAGRRISTFILAAVTALTCQATDPPFTVRHLGDGQSIVRIETQKKFLLLPIEEKASEAKVYMIADNDVVRTLNVRLAVNHIDYFVPVELSGFGNGQCSFNIHLVPDTALCWKEMRLSDTFDTSNRETFRPAYHFSPAYGWMNDPNGMVYVDGTWHLFYQYNPYGSMWGNKHWGHATTTDLVHWQHQPIAIEPDALGTIFSGSCVVDKENTAGFGAGAIIAFYTSASERQMQSMAYSLDGGKSFKKYDRNPILTSTQRDFRDPKVIWHEATRHWIMVLAVGQEMHFYSSPNLKEWTLESTFGEGQGCHEGVWECPDLMELPVEGTELKKWVLLCNINPGGPFGGSATQYFVGTFDGHRFINESPDKTKWQDWGKDHYATVTWSNAPQERHVALAWMSNWQYANDVPTLQYRSANSVPRDLSLYTSDGDTYLKSAPVPELRAIRGKAGRRRSFRIDRTYTLKELLSQNNGTYEIEFTLNNKNADVVGFLLFNSKGEEVECIYDLKERTFSMNRTNSGQTGFSKEFPGITIAPIEKGTQHLRLLIDKSSIEAFGNDGRFAMTNLVFPSEPYNSISFYTKGGSCQIAGFTVYPLQ